MRSLLMGAPVVRLCRQSICGTKRFASALTDANLKLANQLMSGNRSGLARAITLIESSNATHQEQATEMLNYLAENHVKRTNEGEEYKGFQLGRTIRIGVAGPPGAGKSSVIEALGMQLVQANHRVAVIPVDPSSHLSGGSILGDKTRMDQLTRSENAYIRASPTRGVLGGIAEATADVISLCEYAHYDVVIVESVGLGQSEIELDQAVDIFLLIVSPGGGDDLQASKKGIMEACDIIIVNKADGDLLTTAKHTKADYSGTVRFQRRKDPSWQPRVLLASARTGTGIAELSNTIAEFHETMVNNGRLDMKRTRQKKYWMWSHFQHLVETSISQRKSTLDQAKDLELGLANGRVTARKAASVLFDAFKK